MMRIRLSNRMGAWVTLALLTGCGGGGPPPTDASKQAKVETPEKVAEQKPAKVVKAKKASQPSKTDSNASAKSEPKEVEKTVKVAVAPANAKPGTINFVGDSTLVGKMGKVTSGSSLFSKAMSLRRTGKKPPLIVNLAVREGLNQKCLDELAANKVDVKTLEDPKAIRDTAKEIGTAVVLLSLEATEGLGQEAKAIDSIKLESEMPVSGDTAEARTEKALDEAYKAAMDKAVSEYLGLGVDCLALTLLQLEGASARDSLKQLTQLSSDPNELISKKALDVCTAVKAAIREQALVEIKDQDKNIRRRAAEDLFTPDMVAEDVGLATEMLKDQEYEIRSLAALALIDKKLDAEGLGPVLCEVLGDRNNRVTGAAQAGLEKLGSSAVPLLIPKLKDRQSGKQVQRALEAILTNDQNAVAGLSSSLTGDDTELKIVLLSVLGRIGDKPRPLIRELIGIVSGTDAGLRSLAAAVLGHIGADAKGALPALEKAVTDGIRGAADARRDILVDIQNAGKKPPASTANTKSESPVATKKPENPATTDPVAPPPPQVVKQKVLVLADGTEVVVESFMKVGGEYMVKTPDGQRVNYAEKEVKEVKVVEVQPGEEKKP